MAKKSDPKAVDLESKVIGVKVIVHFKTEDTLTQDAAEAVLKGFTYQPVHTGLDWNSKEGAERRPARTYLVTVPNTKQADLFIDELMKNYKGSVSDAYRDTEDITIQ